MSRYRAGSIIRAKVTAIKHFGAFFETRDGTQGLIHISEIANNFIVDINDYLKIGEIINIKVLSIVNSKINGSLNFKDCKIDDSKFKKLNRVNGYNLKYNFSTIKNNLESWRKYALAEINNNSK